MNISDQSNIFTKKLYSLESSSFDNTFETIKMCIKGKLLKPLEHQWKQPLNYISTNLLNLEIQAELDQLNLQNINKFNHNIEQAVQQISNNISFYNALFNTSNSKRQFNLEDIIHNYFHIIEHKIKNNNIQFDYQSLKTSKNSFTNYEPETSLLIILFLYILTDELINYYNNNTLLQLQIQNQSLYISLNNPINEDRFFQNYALELYLIKHLLEKTDLNLTYDYSKNQPYFIFNLQDNK